VINRFLLPEQLFLCPFSYSCRNASIGSMFAAFTAGAYPETTPTTKTLHSVGRVLDVADSGDADYDQTITSYSEDTVTFASAAVKDYLDLVDGDYVVIDSNEHAEINMVADADYSSTACKMVKNLLAGHSTSPKMYKLTQMEIELI